jgi:hypothetical protein
MVHIHGRHLYGKVDHMPGLFYVSTEFWHLNFVPLIPLRSYIVLDRSKNAQNCSRKQVPLRLKSVFVGYLRGWLGAITIASVWLSWGPGFAALLPPCGVLTVFVMFAAGAGLCWCYWKAMTASRPLVLQAVLLVLSTALWFFCSTIEKVAAPRQAGPSLEHYLLAYLLFSANAGMLLFSLSRRATLANYNRALAIAEELGLSSEVVIGRFSQDLWDA